MFLMSRFFKCVSAHKHIRSHWKEFCLSKDCGITLGVNFLPCEMQWECSHNRRGPPPGLSTQEALAEVSRRQCLSWDAISTSNSQRPLCPQQVPIRFHKTYLQDKQRCACVRTCSKAASDFSLCRRELLLTWAYSIPMERKHTEKKVIILWNFFKVFSINLMRFRET